MHNNNSSVNNDKNTRFSAHYSAKDEGCSLQPVLQSNISCTDMQREALHRPRSISLFDTLDDRQPVLKLTTSGSDLDDDDPSEALHSDDKLRAPALTLPKFGSANRRFTRLNTLLLEAVKHRDVNEIKRLIKAGANPNATCGIHCVSVCHLAAMRSDDALTILLNAGAERQRLDRLGRTPLHLAAWAGNVRQIAVLLGFSEDLQNRLEAENMTVATEEEVKRLSHDVKELVNMKCDFGTSNAKLPAYWKDNAVDHNCKEFEKSLPIFQLGWSALHAASARGQSRCARLLIAAGAEQCARDLVGRTPLDIAGTAYYADQNIDAQNFADLVNMLISSNCKNFRIKNRKTIDTPLHTAVELGSLEAVMVLVANKLPVNWLNRAGQTPLHICVKKKLKEHLQILATHGISDVDIPYVVDVKDKDGHTILHDAILEEWGAGVSVAIEAGASITARDNKCETPIHFAAMTGNVEILNEVLNVAKQKDVIDTTNIQRETALFKAVIHGHLDCVKKLLKEGALITKTLTSQVNIFHIAAQKGNLKVLTALLDHDYTITRRMINYLTADDNKGYGPIHFAVENNHPECVKILLTKNTYRSLRTSYGIQKGSTPLHIAAIHNNVEIAKIIMFNNEDTVVHITNDMGWTPLHTASHYGSRDMITLLLKEGADISCSTNGPNNCRKTALDMIMDNLSKPTEFMEDIFDTCISTNDSNLQDPKCEITVNYKMLVPKAEEKVQMKVIDALLKTGDRYGQRRLLVHPLLESFLYLKWKALLPFFYTMLAINAFFVLSLTTFIISVFFYKDTKNPPPLILNSTGWAVVLYITIILIVAQEVLYMNVSNGYFFQLETWVKFSSVCLAVILPYATETILTEVDWARHVATGALLLSWLEMMFLLSRFPNWGYYVLMFGKVSTNVIKILLTFAFLVIGFALSFMIQFHSQMPFESPWAALVKTIVMMTSEFDYKDLIKPKDSEEFVTSLLVIRVIFLTFLILASIVLMNFMVGVAVNDLHNLQVLGNVRRLCKQVEFLESLEHLVYNRLFKKILPNWLEDMLTNRKKILNVFVLSPSVPKSKCYRSLPSHIREAIFEKAQSRKKQMDDELGSQNYKKKLDAIYKATVKIKKDNLAMKNLKAGILKSNTNNKDVEKHLMELDAALVDIKNETKASINQIQSSIDDLSFKMDVILSKLDCKNSNRD